MLPIRIAPLAPSLHAACSRWPERPAVSFRGETLTYRRLWEQVRALAAAYRRLGVRPGDRVLCQLPNCPEHVVAMHAAWLCGAIHAGTDHDLTGPELAWLVDRTQAAVLLFQPRAGAPDALAPLRAVRDACPATIIVVNDPMGDPTGEPSAELSLPDLLARPGDDAATPVSPPGDDDTSLLLLTSGTTGKPKAVMESLRHCWAKVQFFTDACRPDVDDVHLLYLPVAHVLGLRLCLMALMRGGHLVLMDRFSPLEALRLVAAERVTVLPGIATHFTLLLSALDPTVHDVSTLRWAVSAAATMPRPLFEQIRARLGVEMLYIYGCSEGFTTLTTDADDIARGSVGQTVFRGPPGTAPDGTVIVVDPAEHRRLAAGEVGEVAFGARCPVSYWADPPTATDGWYYTGDLGWLDDQDRLYLVGRLKELVNRGGLKVAASEVEAALARHPDVLDAAVIGTPDPVLGEAVCACIVPRGQAPTLGALRSFLGEALARHKLPDELCVVDHIPRTKIGKVDRPALTALVVDGDAPRERLRGG